MHSPYLILHQTARERGRSGITIAFTHVLCQVPHTIHTCSAFGLQIKVSLCLAPLPQAGSLWLGIILSKSISSVDDSLISCQIAYRSKSFLYVDLSSLVVKPSHGYFCSGRWCYCLLHGGCSCGEDEFIYFLLKSFRVQCRWSLSTRRY